MKALNREGELRFTLSLAERPQALVPMADDRLLIALPDHLEALRPFRPAAPERRIFGGAGVSDFRDGGRRSHFRGGRRES